MRELLLAREEVHWLVCLFTQAQITIFLLFAYIKVSTFQEYQNMSQSTKKQGTSIVLFPLWVFIFCLCLNGCTVLNINSFHFGKLGKKEQGQAVKYEICSGKNMPERLQKIIEERKKKPGTFAYKNSKYTYLVVCYGEKSYSGYSVRVEQCWKDKEQLYLETQLIGPAAGEEVVETLTYPFLVVRCGRTELLCRIES